MLLFANIVVQPLQQRGCLGASQGQRIKTEINITAQETFWIASKRPCYLVHATSRVIVASLLARNQQHRDFFIPKLR